MEISRSLILFHYEVGETVARLQWLVKKVLGECDILILFLNR